MLQSTAHVATSSPERYAKQLAGHLGRHSPSEWDGTHGLITMPFGRCTLSAEPEVLVLTADAADEESLSRVEDVAGRHLEQFGARNELSVTWVRENKI